MRRKWLINHATRIRLSETAPYISRQRTEPGIDGLARANLRFSEQGGP